MTKKPNDNSAQLHSISLRWFKPSIPPVDPLLVCKVNELTPITSKVQYSSHSNNNVLLAAKFAKLTH